MRLASLAAAGLLFACATPSDRRPGESDERLGSLGTLGLLAPTITVATGPRADGAQDAWKREAEESVLSAFAAELERRGIRAVRLSPDPATRNGFASLARRFDEVAESAAQAQRRGQETPTRQSLGALDSLSRLCAVDGFIVVSGTALPPREPPRAADFGGRSAFGDIAAAEAGDGLTSDAEVRLSWLAAGIVDRTGELLWLATEGSIADDDGDPAGQAAGGMAERMPALRARGGW